jgi:hypothetical protein
MADTPDELLLAMTDITVDTLARLTYTTLKLPVPISLPTLDAAQSGEDITAPLERLRHLIEDEPIPLLALGHLDQAILEILIAMELVHTAAKAEKIAWRYDAVFATCAAARANLHLTRKYMGQDD